MGKYPDLMDSITGNLFFVVTMLIRISTWMWQGITSKSSEKLLPEKAVALTVRRLSVKMKAINQSFKLVP